MRRMNLIATAIVIAVFLIIVKLKLYEIWDQYNIPAYVQSSADHGGAVMPLPVGPSVDKTIVMAKTKRENTDWVEEYLPKYVNLSPCSFALLTFRSWQAAIYTVDSPSAPLHTPANKGRESMAYLTYIIEHYDSLPSVIAFIHPHLNGFWNAWHTDTPHHDNVDSLNYLNLDYVRKAGYVNLRCNWNPGCLESHRKNAHVTPEIWKELFGSEKMPDLIGAPCCAQFAVSKQQVQKRSKEDYIKFRQWVLDTELSDAKSGRVMEFLWHIIFGEDAV
jgi:hypothetical protein